MQEPDDLDWRNEFSDTDLPVVRTAIAEAIHNSQERSARAHTEYADPDGEQDVYGVGMSRGGPKELQTLLSKLPTYREERVEGTRRTLTYVGDGLLFLQRVGKQMPRNHRRVRLSYLPDTRRELFTRTSNKKYVEPGLFELPEEEPDDTARLSDVLRVVSEAARAALLFVPYYSSTPTGVGTMYWAPARLNGRYLEFTDPERLSYTKTAAAGESKKSTPRAAGGFADGDRPRTDARLRSRPGDQKGSS